MNKVNFKVETVDGKELRVLSLIIKQNYFDAIMQGRKVQEFREIRPTTYKKLIELDEEGYDLLDDNGNAIPIKYDAIRFFVGYNTDRDTALVEIKDAYTEIFVNDDGEPITYKDGRDKDGNPLEWVAQQVVYNLGKIYNSELHQHSRK